MFARLTRLLCAKNKKNEQKRSEYSVLNLSVFNKLRMHSRECISNIVVEVGPVAAATVAAASSDQ